MKRIFCLFLILLLLCPLAACSAGLAVEETEEEIPSETKTQTQTEEEPIPDAPRTYPKGFTVGYNRQDISPKVFPVPTNSGREAHSIHDPVQLTCTAMSDGETAVLLMSVDMRGLPTSFIDFCASIVEKKTGIPKERVFYNCTHTHSAPDNSHLGEGNMLRWQKLFYEKLERCVTMALLDLAPATAVAGKAETDGLTFVRRYLMKDGSYRFNPSFGSAVEHESEADPEMRVIRFTREGKKDVVMVNYQTHYHGGFQGLISADFVHVFRETVEKDLDCHFVYHSGAGANLNFNSAIPGEKKYSGIQNATAHLVDTMKKALENATPVETGPIQTKASYYQANRWPGRADYEHRQSGEKLEVRLYTFAMGDLAFCSAPYEMFDTNGVFIRENSPYPITFVCSCTNGHMGYVPSALAVPHGAYEVDITSFAAGSAEEFASELVRLLNESKKESQ